jgi:AraC-like DNA-binding protein
MLDHSSKPLAVEDPLSEMLRGLRLDGVEYCRCEYSAPWSISYAAQAAASFHFVGSTGCWIRTDSEDWLYLEAGDSVFLPRGSAHVLASSPDALPSPLRTAEMERICDGIYAVNGGGGGESSTLFFASMRFNIDSLHPLFRMMPDLMRAHDLAAFEPAIPMLLEIMVQELRSERVGSGGLLARLADVVAASVIRSWVERGCGDASGWIAAVRNPDIGKVLVAIHRTPERNWTVAELARLMGASRSSFAERFAAVVGETPARYLAQVRMHLARLWLQRDKMRIGVVARRLGYDSEASFSRAYKRIIGVAPSISRSDRIGEGTLVAQTCQ